jgi:Flp pilus assembly protein TadG
MQFLRRILNDRRGSVAVTFSVAVTPMMLMTGAAMDYSRATREKHNMQAALDGALLAAALAKPGERHSTATRVYKANTASVERTGESVTFWGNDTTRTYHGVVQAKVPTTLMKIGGIDNVEVGVKATVSLDNGPVCMLLKALTGIGLDMGSSTAITMPGCEVHVYSSSANAVSFESKSFVEAAEVCVRGDIVYKSALAKASYHPHCTPARDEYVMPVMAPDSDCKYDKQTYNNSPTVKLNPGIICRGMTFKSSADVTFMPGVYRVRGGPIAFMAASTIKAEGVTFYFEDENSFFSMSANSKMSLTAPTSGPTKGIAMFEAPNLPLSNVSYVSAATVSTQGLFYLPSRNIELTSSTGLSARKLTVVANTAKLVSSSTIDVEPLPDEELRLYDRRITLVN